MTTETERLRADIERTRTEVGDDVDALAEKVDPRKAAARRVDSVRDAATSVKDRVMGVEETVSTKVVEAARMPAARTRGNPMAVGVIAFGVGWLLGSVLPMGDREKRLAERARQAAEPVAMEAKERAGQVTEAMREPVREAAERLGESAGSSAEAVKESVSQAVSSPSPR